MLHRNQENVKKTYEGFHQYCAWHNEEFSTKHSSIFLSANHKELALKVPCLGEFFKYIAWHNLANLTIEKMGVPSLTIHYEDYHENFHETFSDLISFLEEWYSLTSLVLAKVAVLSRLFSETRGFTWVQ